MAGRMLGLGLLSGGYGEDELIRAGAFRVFPDPADIASTASATAPRRSAGFLPAVSQGFQPAGFPQITITRKSLRANYSRREFLESPAFRRWGARTASRP